AQRGVRPEKLRTELIQNGQLSEVASQLRDQKTADQLVAKAKKIEVSAEEWNEHIKAKKAKEAAARAPGKPRKTTAASSSTKKAKEEEVEDVRDEGKPAAKPAVKKKTSKKK